MTHFPVIVLTSPGGTYESVQDEVERLLAPYDEGGEWFRDADSERPASRWDWWTIGGRWTGSLDGYEPEKDPANIEPCPHCAGTGRRPDADRFGPDWVKATNGCNGCNGVGTRVAWPTQWKPHQGDVQPASAVGDFLPYAVVTPDGAWHEKGEMGWWGIERDVKESDGDWRMIVQKLLAEHAECTAVLVDCHV